MKTIAFDSYGPPTRLKLRDMPRPEVAPDHLLIRVKAAGVNPIDWKLRSGELRWILPLTFPVVLGYDVSGEIESVGRDLSDKWSVGQQVCAYSNHRTGKGYAEFLSVSAEHVVHKPENLSHIEAAAIPLAASTAWQSLFDLASLRPGDKVLINGASGGVGHFAIQIAKIHHAHVTAVCSGRNELLVRELGADDVINYHHVDFTQLDRKFDVIFDAVGKASYRDCRQVLDRDGRFATTLPSAETAAYSVLSKFQRRRCGIVLARSRRKDLQAIYDLASQGKLRTVIDEVFSLENGADAHRKSEDGHAVGKIVLQVAEE